MLQANYQTLLSLNLSKAEFATTKKLFQIAERRAKTGCQINFLKRCTKNNIVPNTIRNIKLPALFNLPNNQCSREYLLRFCMKKLLQHLHLTLHKQIEEYEKTLCKLTTNPEPTPSTTLSAINQSYHNCVEHNKKRLIKKYMWLQQKKQHHQDTHHTDTRKKRNTHTPDSSPTTTSQVTDLTNSLTKKELDVLSLGPKFIVTQKLNDRLLLDIETNFCRTAYQLKWLSKIREEGNTNTNTTNTFPTYTLDLPIHPPPANKELDSKLAELKRSIFSIIKKHHNTQGNLSSTQKQTLTSMRNRDLVYLPSDKGKEFCVISQNNYNQLALDHLKDNNTYIEITNTQPTHIQNKINDLWINICKRRHISNRHKNNFITRNSRLPNFYHLIKTHKNETTPQIRPIISSIEGPLYKISWLLSQILNPYSPPSQDTLRTRKK